MDYLQYKNLNDKKLLSLEKAFELQKEFCLPDIAREIIPKNSATIAETVFCNNLSVAMKCNVYSQSP